VHSLKFEERDLEWKSVEVSKTLNGVQIRWVTGREKGLAQYELERSTDGQFFQRIDSRMPLDNGSDENAYEYIDSGVMTDQGNGLYYYRIKERRKTGNFSYSPVAKLNLQDKAENGLEILSFPHPVTSQLSLRWKAIPGTLEVRMINGMCQVVKSEVLPNGSDRLEWDVSDMGPGFYTIHIRTITSNQVAAGRRIWVKGP
ncbi:MAG: hypothetical protein AAFY71_20560, partial [Bacteroidota bacterium]